MRIVGDRRGQGTAGKTEALHQAGAFPLAPIRDAYDRCGVAATVTDYIKDMDGAYEWADFVIACAGAQTLAELSVCGLPCLIVPLSAAAAGHHPAGSNEENLALPLGIPVTLDTERGVLAAVESAVV